MISMIAATDRNGVIGYKDGGLPWKVPSEHRHYREIVKNRLLVMSRKNFEYSHQDNPDDQIVLLSRTRSLKDFSSFPQVKKCFSSVRDFLLWSSTSNEEIFVLGGSEIYRDLMPWCERLYLSELDLESDGTVRFPPIGHYDWTCLKEEKVSDEIAWHWRILQKVPLNTPS